MELIGVGAGEERGRRAVARADDRIITRAEFARSVGVSRSAVTQAVARGRLRGAALLPDGRLRLGEALRQWRGDADPRRELGQLLAEPAMSAPTPARDEGDEDPDYKAEKTREAQLKNAILEIELGRKQDRFRDVDEIARAMTTAGRNIRQKLDQVVTWADELAALPCGDAGAIRAFLRDKARTLETDIAAQLAALGDDDAEVDA